VILGLHEVGIFREGVELANRFARLLGDLGQFAYDGVAGEAQLAHHFADHLQNFRETLRTDYDKRDGEQEKYFEYVQVFSGGVADTRAISIPMITIAFQGVNDA
jgi:hypothetical protein